MMDCKHDADITNNNHLAVTPDNMNNISAMSTIIIKFIFNDSILCTISFRTDTTIGEVKTKLAEMFHEEIEIEKDSAVIGNDVTLMDIGAIPLGTIELGLKCCAGVDLTKLYRPTPMPTVDVIMVRIFEGKKQIKEYVVEIEKSDHVKPWLGGYRNKMTRTEYHHAETQTVYVKNNQVQCNNQSAQTPVFPLKHTQSNTMITRRTQTRSRYIPDIGDVFKKASDKSYVTYDEWLNKYNIVDHVIKIQTWYRHIKMKKRQKNILEHLYEYTELQVHTKEELRKKLDRVDSADNNLIKKKPSSRHDFDVLYMIIGKWWTNEMQRIRDIPDETIRKNEHVKLLQKEIYYLSKLDRCRAECREKAEQKQLLCLLNKAAKPKKMITSNNKEVSISTIETQKATVLKNIYVKIIRRDVNTEERIEILNEFTDILLKCEGIEFIENILALVRKEIDQMYVGVPKKNLEMTRNRIELLFSKFLNFPEYNKNSKAIRMSGRLRRGATPEERYFTCSRCNRTLPASEYPAAAQKSVHRICNSCEWVENVGSKRIDLKPYKQMLNTIQKRELDKNSTSSLCFGMQPSGMYYLVNVIWDGRSAITEASEISSLQCIRWDRTQDWSPWNCIVLTTQEAELHENINDVKEFYSADFITKVTLRHISARIQFLSLQETEDSVQFTGEFNEFNETNVLLDKEYVKSFMNIDSAHVKG
uniref:IQ and ubiquitin-like domain-containing protein n=3 Tax=Cacopsylla melanoneura TaxID=428564 RepID=A0A8D8TEM7_9HEMI